MSDDIEIAADASHGGDAVVSVSEIVENEALKDGRYECVHCQADEYLGSKQHGEKLSTKLSKADPDEVAPTEFDRERERASVSLAWFVAVWLVIMAASTFTGVMLYFAGVRL